MKLNRKLVLVLALVLSVAMATTGTLAYLTDRDSAVNVFTMGNVDIKLVEDFAQNSKILPGVTVNKAPHIENIGGVDAYVWMKVAIPSGAYNSALKIDFANQKWTKLENDPVANQTIEDETGTFDVYTFLYNDVLAAGTKTSDLFTKVEMDETVDVKPNGDVHTVTNGGVSDKLFNIADGRLPIYVTAYAIQAEGSDTVADAYAKYTGQWGENNNTWGAASFEPSESLTEKDGVILINNASDLLAFANNVNNGTNQYGGKTVKLTADIDLMGANWTPIGTNTPNYFFQGTFDGDNHTIKNLKVDMSAVNVDRFTTAGLFGWVNTSATIKNLKIDHADVVGNHYTGAVVGYMSGTIENCHVKNAIINSKYHDTNNSGDKAGAVIGYLDTNTKAINCSAEDSTVSAGRDAGQVVGGIYGGNNVKVSKCWATNVTVKANGSGDGSNIGERIIGRNSEYNTGENIQSYNTQDALTTALKVNEKYIVVSLDADLTVTVDSGTTWTNAFGGNNTESVTILGNGHTITFHQQDKDWNHVATNGAKLIINNATIDNSGYNDGPWNRHDIVFDCEVELNNVISNKAIALKKNGELNNVTIEDKNTEDTYHLWIQANGQTVSLNNCEIKATNGEGNVNHRAIAIKDEYVDTTCKKVTLNVSNTKIASQKKAAILVTSKAGATINLSNVNISGTSDTNNAVWIDNDNDYKNVSDTTVTGGNCILEPNTESFL